MPTRTTSNLTGAQQAEIDEMRAQRTLTRRATVGAMEDVLYEALPVLDHGFIRVVDYMGDDAAIVQAARVSYGSGTKQSRNDQGLINYLMRNSHTSPFEMCEIKLHVKLPIFVARQWIRHRTANVNEYSARYSILDNEFYIPQRQNLGMQSATNMQGREAADYYQPGLSSELAPARISGKSQLGGDVLQGRDADRVIRTLERHAKDAYEDYLVMLNETPDGEIRDENRRGLTRELARMVLPVNFYTQWYWKVDLHNLLHFLRLRADLHAQWEIREYATAIDEIVQKWVPKTHKAFHAYRLGGAALSERALEAVRRMLAGEQLDAAAAGMSPGEWRELQALLAKQQH